jgi:cystathionine beta-lyase/cystathionine gamma-synthase
LGVIDTMDEHRSEIKLESWLVSAGRDAEPGAPLNIPLIPASNFIIGGGRQYSRGDGTPTWEALEVIVGGLESGKAVAFASGMAAIAAVFDQLVTGAVVALRMTAMKALPVWQPQEKRRDAGPCSVFSSMIPPVGFAPAPARI